VLQQVNLYKLLPKLERSPLTDTMLLLLYSVFFFVLLLDYFYGLNVARQQNKQVTFLNMQVNTAQNKLIETANQYPKVSLQAVWNNVSCNTHFSAYLEALAKASIPSVWLTEISISENGQYVSLKGRALKAVYVQEFLDHLKSQAIFSTIPFELQELSDKKFISFYLVAKVPNSHA
jgi:Tfp pilus assembly protein PilN